MKRVGRIYKSIQAEEILEHWWKYNTLVGRESITKCITIFIFLGGEALIKAWELLETGILISCVLFSVY